MAPVWNVHLLAVSRTLSRRNYSHLRHQTTYCMLAVLRILSADGTKLECSPVGGFENSRHAELFSFETPDYILHVADGTRLECSPVGVLENSLHTELFSFETPDYILHVRDCSLFLVGGGDFEGVTLFWQGANGGTYFGKLEGRILIVIITYAHLQLFWVQSVSLLTLVACNNSVVTCMWNITYLPCIN